MLARGLWSYLIHWRDRECGYFFPHCAACPGQFSGLIREEGIATIFVDKDHRSLSKVADRMVVPSKGEIAFDGTPAELKADPSILEKHLGV